MTLSSLFSHACARSFSRRASITTLTMSSPPTSNSSPKKTCSAAWLSKKPAAPPSSSWVAWNGPKSYTVIPAACRSLTFFLQDLRYTFRTIAPGHRFCHIRYSHCWPQHRRKCHRFQCRQHSSYPPSSVPGFRKPRLGRQFSRRTWALRPNDAGRSLSRSARTK